MKLIREEIKRLDKVEALVVSKYNGHKIPKLNEEILTMSKGMVLGKDKDGYYAQNVSIKGMILI